MESFQSFDDMPPAQCESSNYAPGQETYYWPPINYDYSLSYHRQPSFALSDDYIHTPHGSNNYPPGARSMSALSLLAQASQQETHMPNCFPGAYRLDSLEASLSCDSAPIQPDPLSPGLAYEQRATSPIGTIRSISSVFGEQLSLRRSYTTSDQDSVGSPGPVSPPAHEVNNYAFGLPPYLENTTGSWATDPYYCALHQVQQFPDEGDDHYPELVLDAEVNLGEAEFKEEPLHQAPPFFDNMDERDDVKLPREQITANGRRWTVGADEDNDSDYKPTATKPRRTQPTSNGRQSNTIPKSKVSKRAVPPKPAVDHTTSKEKAGKQMLPKLTAAAKPQKLRPISPNKTSSNNDDDTAATMRPYSCPLAPYGCLIDFISKNEWKRHISSRHVRLGIYRCDLCPDWETRPNDFNRKDLFVQHLRRMHHPHKGDIDNGIRDPSSFAYSPPSSSAAAIGKKAICKKGSNNSNSNVSIKTEQQQQTKKVATAAEASFEASIPAIRDRCWKEVREGPREAYCGFCDTLFQGASSFEDWLEHTARHLADASKQKSQQTTKGQYDARWATEKWAKDEILRGWLLEHGVLKPGSVAGTWVITADAA